MFDIYCSSCDHIYLVGSRSLAAFRNTDGAPVALARCPHGHEVIADFSTDRARRPVPVPAPRPMPVVAHAA